MSYAYDMTQFTSGSTSPAGVPASALQPVSIIGQSAPLTNVTPAGSYTYHVDMDTSGGGITISNSGAITGVPEGGTISYTNDGSNPLTYTHPITGFVYTFDQGDILSLQYTNGEWLIV